jgi:hypothetical protein
MSGLFGGGGKNANNSGYYLTGGGANAPFEMGPTPFDLQSIAQSVMGNEQAVTNRYNQLGLGGSTMAGQDVAGAQQMGQALTGQEQTQDVTNPALNPALQPPINQLVGVGQNQQSNAASDTALGTAVGAGLTAA